MHYARSLALRRGLRPWRAAVHQAQHCEAAADVLGRRCLLRHGLGGWSAAVAQQQHLRAQEEQRRAQLADQHDCRWGIHRSSISFC